MVDEIRRIMSEITGRDFSNINENISLFSSAIGLSLIHISEPTRRS